MLRTTFPPAFRYRPYRLLWLGLLLSIAGNSMQTAAVLWHINELSGQPIALGGVGLVRILPVLAFSLLAGVIADVVDRRRLMVITQILQASLAAVLAWCTLNNKDTIGLIYTIIATTSAVMTFDLPARQSLVPNLVPREVLTNAFSLNSIARHFGSVIGPAIGGLVLASYGVASAYLINALSFTAVIASLLLMGPVPQKRNLDGVQRKEASSNREGDPENSSKPIWKAVKDGLYFVFHQPIILSSMLLDFFATFFSSAIFLLPIFATKILAVGATGYGLLISAPSIGAGLASLVLSFREKIQRQGQVLLSAISLFGFATIIFGLSRTFWLTFAALALTGVADSVSTIIRHTIRQLQTPDHLRGRMTSVNQMFFMGGPQLGELEAGVVAQVFGAPAAVISGGIACLLSLVWIDKRFPQLRRFQGHEPIEAGDQASYPIQSNE